MHNGTTACSHLCGEHPFCHPAWQSVGEQHSLCQWDCHNSHTSPTFPANPRSVRSVELQICKKNSKASNIQIDKCPLYKRQHCLSHASKSRTHFSQQFVLHDALLRTHYHLVVFHNLKQPVPERSNILVIHPSERQSNVILLFLKGVLLQLRVHLHECQPNWEKGILHKVNQMYKPS